MTAYMDFLITSFWSTMLGHNFAQPNFTDLMRLAESIVRVHYTKKRDTSAEGYEEYHREDHQRLLQKLQYLNEKVNEHINTPLATIEFMIFKNWHKSPDSSIMIHSRDFKMYALFQELNVVLRELTEIVNDIGMYYSLDTEYGAGIFGGMNRKPGERMGLSLGKKIKGD